MFTSDSCPGDTGVTRARDRLRGVLVLLRTCKAGLGAITVAPRHPEPIAQMIHAFWQWSFVLLVWLMDKEEFTSMATVVSAPDALPWLCFRWRVAFRRQCGVGGDVLGHPYTHATTDD